MLRRLLLASTMSLCALAISVASAANSISRPVGFVRFNLAPDSQTLVSVPLEPLNASANSILTGQLTPNDRLLKWNAAEQAYDIAIKTTDSWVNDGTNLASMTFSPGEAFWVENHQPTGQTVYLFGRVVMDEQVNMDFQPLLNMYGFPYTTASGEWLLGQGYWFDNVQTQVVPWVVSRPYDDIFTSLDEAPSIDALATTSGGVNLSINAVGLEGVGLAILYQDLTPTGILNSTQGWLIADRGVAVAADNVTWNDSGTAQRPAPFRVFARLYLVIRADMDLNANGVPDILEGGRFNSMGSLSLTPAGSGASSSGSAGSGNSQQTIDQQEEGTLTNAAPPSFIITYGRPVIYVDAQSGDDQNSGTQPSATEFDGPKKTIQAGLTAASDQATVVIRGGAYGEDLNIAGRSVDVRIEGSVDISGVPHGAPQQWEPPQSFTNSDGIVERTQP